MAAPATTSCHCGAVTIALTRPIKQLTRCNCSICRRYGALWAYQQRKAVNVTAAALASYRWGKKTIAFHHCPTCGCVTHYTRAEARADDGDMCAVNMRLTDQPARIARLPIRTLDGADTWDILTKGPEPHLFHGPLAEDART